MSNAETITMTHYFLRVWGIAITFPPLFQPTTHIHTLLSKPMKPRLWFIFFFPSQHSYSQLLELIQKLACFVEPETDLALDKEAQFKVQASPRLSQSLEWLPLRTTTNTTTKDWSLPSQMYLHFLAYAHTDHSACICHHCLNVLLVNVDSVTGIVLCDVHILSR